MKKIINKLDENGENLLKMDLKQSSIHSKFITVRCKKNYKYSFEIVGDLSNCKLSYVHKIGQLVNFSDGEKKEIIHKILWNCKGVVIFNTTSSIVAQFLNDNYQVYYYNTPPVGYGPNVQHHICIRNQVVRNSSCDVPKEQNYLQFGIPNIKSKLKKILKEKRRKDDYVDDFIKSL